MRLVNPAGGRRGPARIRTTPGYPAILSSSGRRRRPPCVLAGRRYLFPASAPPPCVAWPWPPLSPCPFRLWSLALVYGRRVRFDEWFSLARLGYDRRARAAAGAGPLSSLSTRFHDLSGEGTNCVSNCFLQSVYSLSINHACMCSIWLFAWKSKVGSLSIVFPSCRCWRGPCICPLSLIFADIFQRSVSATSDLCFNFVP